jgi:hypothetical protein
MLNHRGGEEVLLDVGGQDSTEAFEDVGHSDEAREILDGMLVGTLKRQVRLPDTHSSVFVLPPDPRPPRRNSKAVFRTTEAHHIPYYTSGKRITNSANRRATPSPKAIPPPPHLLRHPTAHPPASACTPSSCSAARWLSVPTSICKVSLSRKSPFEKAAVLSSQRLSERRLIRFDEAGHRAQHTVRSGEREAVDDCDVSMEWYFRHWGRWERNFLC